MKKKAARLGVDIGGTFTAVLELDGARSSLDGMSAEAIAKVLSGDLSGGQPYER